MSRQLNIIAFGDSWFDYPKLLLTGGGLIDHLETVSGLSISNYAHAGDPTLTTMGLKRSQQLESVLPGADILLFSGGGDDLAGDQFCIWLNQNTDGDISKAINWNRLGSAMALIIANYEDLLDIRDRLAPNCLIVTHSYDFPVASQLGHGVLFGLLGPWLKPGLDWCGWTKPSDQVQIVKSVMQEFQNRMAAFAAKNWLHLHVNTQGTLAPEDWDNEIHANDAGWAKLAQVVNLAMLPLLDKLQLLTSKPSSPALPSFASEAVKVAGFVAEAVAGQPAATTPQPQSTVP